MRRSLDLDKAAGQSLVLVQAPVSGSFFNVV